MIVKEKEQKTYVIEDIGPVERKVFYSIVKRIFDIVMSLLALIVLFIPMLMIALMIKLDTHGAVLFRQERLGKDGKPFMLYKFRSMIQDAEANGPQWAKANDERCTKFGYVLRQSRIDELPQLLNIIKGEMSFVGPRPERACFYQEFEEYIPGFSKRLCVIPGLTGWAQVNGGYNLGPEEKIVYDMEYIEKQSLRMDIQCIFKTFKVVFSRDGAR